jgi:hypothetical protein
VTDSTPIYPPGPCCRAEETEAEAEKLLLVELCEDCGEAPCECEVEDPHDDGSGDDCGDPSCHYCCVQSDPTEWADCAEVGWEFACGMCKRCRDGR